MPIGQQIFRDIMIMPQAETMADRVRMGEEIYQALKTIIEKKGYSDSIGDEGGFARGKR